MDMSPFGRMETLRRSRVIILWLGAVVNDPIAYGACVGHCLQAPKGCLDGRARKPCFLPGPW